MIAIFRQKKVSKAVSMVIIVTFLMEWLIPLKAYAITGGPSQPEVEAFTQVGTSDMVDPFTGDFTYNIPLLQVGDYPLNLVYNSGVTPDQDASWVGLGWTLNPGSVTRNLRGLADDFNGETMTKEFNIKSNTTVGINATFNKELIGTDLDKMEKGVIKNNPDSLKQSKLGKLNFSAGIFYNNYNGYGTEVSISPTTSSGDKAKGELTGGLGISANSQSGVGIDPKVSFSRDIKKKTDKEARGNWGISIAMPFNSRSGLKEVSINASVKRNYTIPNLFNKDKKSPLNLNGGTSYSFASSGFTPQTQMPLLTTNFSITGKLGLASYGLHGNLAIRGYYIDQFLLSRTKYNSAYGYMYTGEGNAEDRAMFDYNRNKSFSFSEDNPNLPVTAYTYDMFNVTGQGIGGSFRTHRRDVGVMFNDATSSYSTAVQFPDFEFGAAAISKLGTNVSANFSETYNGPWRDNNSMWGLLLANNNGDEPYYFKQVGEKVPFDDETLLANLGGTSLISANLIDGKAKVSNGFNKFDGTGSIGIGSNIMRQKRAKRNSNFIALTAQEAYAAALEKFITTYSFNNSSLTSPPALTPQNSYSRMIHPGHHISEVTVINNTGSRYVYGIPAYNNYQEESSFAINEASCKKDITAGYDASDNSKENSKGRDHFYEKVKTPAYAHSFLITAVLTPDYMDKTGNGPSKDDLGNYTKFNYSKISNYQWRTPYTETEKVANYNPGLMSIASDDKANYVYGTKDVWFVHSIESRDYIAIFYTSDRDDGTEARGVDGGTQVSGGVTLKKMKKLDRIELYARTDYEENGSNAIPIKTVFFEYNYSLCPDVISNVNDGGKLTLKKIYFTFGQSKRSASRAYTLYYNTSSSLATCTTDGSLGTNFSYSARNCDRWGNYKSNASGLPSNEFPYTYQNKAEQDKNASAWCLTAIKLPTGGIIRVELESDDYAYVQNRKAMVMAKVVGSHLTKPDMVTNMDNLRGTDSYTDCNNEPVNYKKAELYETGTASSITGVGKSSKEYIVVELPKPVSGYSELESLYFKESAGKMMSNLLYRFKVGIEDDEDINADKFETIQGYIGRDDFEYGICEGFTANVGGNTLFTHAWIRLKSVPLGDNVPHGNANPIAHSGWNFVRLNLPHIGNNGNDPDDISAANAYQILTSLATSVMDIIQLVTGYFYNLRQRNICRVFEADNSFVRLYAPGVKLGGGTRVKKVLINDQFSTMLGNNTMYQNYDYGQTYDYTTTDEQGNLISSGVASYEPLMGGEENVFREPDIMKSKFKFLVPSEEFLTEQPFAESLFPSPNVGYSKVKVQNIQHTGVTSSATGYTLNEFYTAKEFPTIAQRSPTEHYRNKPIPLLSMVKLQGKDEQVASQGYVIELNDMHSKPRAVKEYSQNDSKTPFKSTEYYYHVDQFGRVSNQVTSINQQGEVKDNRLIGVDIDLVSDAVEEISTTHSTGLGGNLDMFLAAILPVAIPFLLPDYTYEKTQFKAITLTKVVNRYAITDSVVTQEGGSRVSMYNQAYDDETGEVLLTRTNNQFGDYVYQFNYPAHFYYDGMRQSYHRSKLKVRLDEAVAHPNLYFNAGDEVLISGEIIPPFYGWVYDNGPGQFSVISIDGIKYWINNRVIADPNSTVTIIRTAQKNMPNTSIGKVVALSNPIQSVGGIKTLSFNQVINAEAIEFGDVWAIHCGCEVEPGQYYNPYVEGRKGNLRPLRNYLYLTDRNQYKLNNNLNTRTDGLYADFSPFWKPTGSGWVIDNFRWTFATEVTNYNPFGLELESKDALNRYSAIQYGYNMRLPLTMGSNMQLREVGFDGFEDYHFYECTDNPHFGFKKALEEIVPNDYRSNDNLELYGFSTSFAHTGMRSFSVKEAGEYVKMKKTLIPCNLKK